MGRRPNPERRVEVLAAVTDHVLARGLHQTALRGLAQELGTSTYTFVYHFGSKDGMIAEALQQVNERREAGLDALATRLEGGIEDQARERREARKREFEERLRRAEEAHQRQLEKEREHQQRIVAREKQTLAELIKEGLAENPTLLMQMTLLQMRREEGEIDKTQYELMCNVIAEDCMAYMKGKTGMPQPNCRVRSLKIRGEGDGHSRVGAHSQHGDRRQDGQKFSTTACAVYELLKGACGRPLARP